MKTEDIVLGILAIGLIGYIIVSKKQEIKAQAQTSQPKTETVSVSPFVSSNVPTNVAIPTTATQTTTVPITTIQPIGQPSTTISYKIVPQPEPINLPKDSVDDYITISQYTMSGNVRWGKSTD